MYEPSDDFDSGDRSLKMGEYIARICRNCGKRWGQHIAGGYCHRYDVRDRLKEEPLGNTPPVRPEITTTVSVSRKVSDLNYGAGEVFISLSGITAATTPDEIDEMLAQSQLTFVKIRDAIKAKTAATVNYK